MLSSTNLTFYSQTSLFQVLTRFFLGRKILSIIILFTCCWIFFIIGIYQVKYDTIAEPSELINSSPIIISLTTNNPTSVQNSTLSPSPSPTAAHLISNFSNIKNSKTFFSLSVNERLKYYLTPKWYNFYHQMITNSSTKPIIINSSVFLRNQANRSRIPMSEYIILSSNYLRTHAMQEKGGNFYRTDAFRIMNDRKVEKACSYAMFQFGDSPLNHSLYPLLSPSNISNGVGPIFKKTRYVNEQNVILSKLTQIRHWHFWSTVISNDKPYEEKNNHIIWRGTMTGYEADGYPRYELVRKYLTFNSRMNISANETLLPTIDIAFYKKGQNYNRWMEEGKTDVKHMIRYSINYRQSLRSKYLISIEGNDIATNLNWIMFSNSVPFLLEPIVKEAWTMQGLFQPYVHYIPFKIEDDSLLKAFEFCEQNEMKCAQIARNGKEFMKQFRDENKEREIEIELLMMYCKMVEFV